MLGTNKNPLRQNLLMIIQCITSNSVHDTTLIILIYKIKFTIIYKLWNADEKISNLYTDISKINIFIL